MQRLARLLRGAGQRIPDPDVPDGLVEWYIEEEYGVDQPEWCEMLLATLRAKALVILLDGVDEAAALRTRMQTLILQVLAPSDCRVVVTTRPEGIPVEDDDGVRVLDKFTKIGFSILDLSKLNDDQVRRAIDQQLKGSSFFDNLFRFGKIRKEHDLLYRRKAFPNLQDRRRIEQWPKLDRLKRPTGELDPSMRQHNVKGTFVRAVNDSVSAPQSVYLSELLPWMSDEMFKRLDKTFAELKSSTSSSASADDIEGMLPPIELESSQRDKESRERAAKIVGKLLKLSQKLHEVPTSRFRLKPSELWQPVWRRSDQIYVAAEQSDAFLDSVLNQLITESGSKDAEFIRGPMKVRRC